MDDPALVEHGLHRRHQGGELLIELDHPAGHRLAADVDALAGEDLLLAIQRQGIDELARHHVGDQGAVADGLGQDLRGAWGDHHPLLGAGNVLVDGDVLGALEVDDVGLAGDHRQLLGLVIADEGPLRAHGLLVGLGQVDDALDPRQVLRQGPTHGLGLGLFGSRRLGLWRRRLLQLLFELGDQRLELGLIEELELIGGDAVGTGAETLAFEQRDVVEQLLDVLLTVLEGLLVLRSLTLQFGDALLQPRVPRYAAREGDQEARQRRFAWALLYQDTAFDSAR